MEDVEIVELLYSHNDKGLKETKDKYGKLLNSLSYRILKNSEDASECVNDTYLKIWDVIPPYRPSHFKSFLLKIVRQISIDKYRYNHRINRYDENSVYLSELDYDVKDTRDLEKEVESNLLKGTINKFLECLDKEDRIIFIRKYFLFEDTRSIAKRYGLKENNVTVKLFRTKKKLKEYLEKEGYIIEKK